MANDHDEFQTPRCHVCHAEAFRFCRLCGAYYCVQDTCVHLTEVTFVETSDGAELTEADGRGGFSNDRTSAGEATSPASEVLAYDTDASSEARGQHWLSYDAILASMDDRKLRQALARYKVLCHQIEIELLSRSMQVTTPRRASLPRPIRSLASQRASRKSAKGARAIVVEALRNGTLTVETVLAFLKEKKRK